jgi:hypothetical protein
MEACHAILLYLPPLFLPFGLRFRHGSCDGGTCMVPRKEVASKPDTSERRARAICLDSGFLRVIFFAPIIALRMVLLRLSRLRCLEGMAMDYAEGKSTGQALTCPAAAR